MFEKISHESIGIYYHRIKKVIKFLERKKRRLIAVNKAKVREVRERTDPHLECDRRRYERMPNHLGM